MVSGILHFTIYSFLTQYFDKLNRFVLLEKKLNSVFLLIYTLEMIVHVVHIFSFMKTTTLSANR
jgi:hypothetical protein